MKYIKLGTIIIILILANTILHTKEIKCENCGKVIKSGIYYTVSGKNYCPDCYQKYFVHYCSVCGKELKGNYIKDFFGNIYHKRHEKEYKTCEFCGRLICPKLTGGGKTYTDGTNICNLCYNTAVLRKDQAKNLINMIISELHWFNIDIDVNKITVKLVDKKELAIASKRKKVDIYHKGLTIYNYYTNEENEIMSGNYTIYILYGMPEINFIEVASHELMHAWQFDNAPLENDEKLSEGSCNYAAYLVLNNLKKKPQYYLDKENNQMINYLITNLENDKNPIYGDGYRMIRDYVTKYGIRAWLKYLKTHKKMNVNRF